MTPALNTQTAFATVLQMFRNGGLSSLSPRLLDACVKVHDDLVSAAEQNALTGPQGDLLDTMMGFIRSTPVIEAFEEILMATAYDVGIAQGRRSIVVDLALARGVSRGHADRKIKRGRVLVAFHRAGKVLLLPTGRKIEMLGGLPDDHWIPCWEFVVKRAEKKGKVSDKNAEIQIKIWEFQHRQDTKSLELRSPETSSPEPAAESHAETQAGESQEKLNAAPNRVPSDFAIRLYALLSPRARGALASILRRGDPVKTALGVFIRLAGKKQPGNGDKTDSLFAALREANPDLVERLERKGRMLVLRECSLMVEQYAVQLGKAAKHYHDQKAQSSA